MIIKVFAVEKNEPFSEHNFSVLMSTAHKDKKQTILNQRIKSNADNSLIGIALAKYALSEIFGLHGNELEIEYMPNGKPFIKNVSDVHLSISHSDNVTVCAVSDLPVGVDVEKIRNFNHSMSEKVFGVKITRMLSESATPNKDFTRLWTEKEAILKLTGEGISGIRKNLNLTEYNSKTTFYKNYCITVVTKKALTAE